MRDLLNGSYKRMTRTEYLADFWDKYWTADSSGIWKLERLQNFQETGYQVWEAFNRGDWAESLRLLEADRAEIAAHHRRLTAAGTSLTWIRAVEPPLNPYVRWNLHVLRIREQPSNRPLAGDIGRVEGSTAEAHGGGDVDDYSSPRAPQRRGGRLDAEKGAGEIDVEDASPRSPVGGLVADSAGVSKATLFKQFPTKAALFDAIVIDSWAENDVADLPPAGDLTVLGRRYAALLSQPEMTDLFRIVIAELPRFPELAKAHFSQGKLPYFESVRIYLLAERDAGAADIADPEMAATQFLGMISNYLFWPSLLLPDWTVTRARTTAVVDEAVRTMVARYGTDVDRPGL